MVTLSTHSFESLFPPQREIIENGFLTSREHWLISLPTGSGKTLLGELALLDSIRIGYKGVYLSPLKAIVEEKYHQWQKQYTNIRFGLFTGDTLGAKGCDRPPSVDILICTPERFDAYLRNWKKNISWISDVDVAVVDELHLLGQGKRGARLEALITRLIRLNPFTRLIGLSATLANLDELAEWLHARTYRNNWRLVPVEKRVQRFTKASDKSHMLRQEIEETISHEGKVLVFVNSRKRAEFISNQLKQNGILSAYHHAGLPRAGRIAIEDSFRRGDLDVLISTPTLEMGINLPARKVVLYDGYAFSDDGRFIPLPVLNYVQRAGRAGRPGLDSEGESVLFIPSWSGKASRYENEEIEPIRSPLFDRNLLAEQVLSEISSRMSITRHQLEKGFADNTLWRFQGGQRKLDEVIGLLIEAEMVKETARDGIFFLNPTAIGRLGVQLFLSPKTVLLIRRCYEHCSTLFLFDLLLLATLLPESEPRLWFDFEEIDHFGDQILVIPSIFLDHPSNFIARHLSELNERHLLSSLKAATLLYQRINGIPDEDLTDNFSCYPSDMHLLAENGGWLLGAIEALYRAMRKMEMGDDERLQAFYRERRQYFPLPEDLCRELIIRVRYGLPAAMVSLARIPGVGGLKAKALWKAGFCDPEDVALAEPADVASIPGFGVKSAKKIVEKAQDVIKMNNISYHEEGVERQPAPAIFPPGIDPYRLRRALSLSIRKKGLETAIVTGGSEPRRVKIEITRGKREYRCDCPDFEKRHLPCKHILRVQMEYPEGKGLFEILRNLQREADVPLRYSLGQLWIKSTGVEMTGGMREGSEFAHEGLGGSSRKRR